MERKYSKALRLLNETTKNLSELKELFNSDNDEILTKEERDKLQLAMMKFTATIKEFNNGK